MSDKPKNPNQNDKDKSKEKKPTSKVYQINHGNKKSTMEVSEVTMDDFERLNKDED